MFDHLDFVFLGGVLHLKDGILCSHILTPRMSEVV